jgi:hypothetical protein
MNEKVRGSVLARVNIAGGGRIRDAAKQRKRRSAASRGRTAGANRAGGRAAVVRRRELAFEVVDEVEEVTGFQARSSFASVMGWRTPVGQDGDGPFTACFEAENFWRSRP